MPNKHRKISIFTRYNDFLVSYNEILNHELLNNYNELLNHYNELLNHYNELLNHSNKPFKLITKSFYELVNSYKDLQCNSYKGLIIIVTICKIELLYFTNNYIVITHYFLNTP